MNTHCQWQEYSLRLILTLNALTILILSILGLFFAVRYCQCRALQHHGQSTKSSISPAEAPHNDKDPSQVESPPKDYIQHPVEAFDVDESCVSLRVELLPDDRTQEPIDVSHGDKNRTGLRVESLPEDSARDVVSSVEASHDNKNHAEPLSEAHAVIPMEVSQIEIESPPEGSSRRLVSPAKVSHDIENRVSLQVKPDDHTRDTTPPMVLSHDIESLVHLQAKPLPEDRAKFAISPDDASVKCRSIGIDVLLSRLNTLFDTSVNKSHDGIEQTLSYFANSDQDVGMAYGCLRRIWYMKGNLWDNFSDCQMVGEQWEKERRDSIKGHFIHQPRSIKPRRIWDLYAHRVIPFEFSKIDPAIMKSNIAKEMYDGRHFFLSQHVSVPHTWTKLPYTPPFHPSTAPNYYVAVSHSWVKDMSISAIETDVNGREWPVPFPPGVTLEALRSELLHLVPSGYIWVDIFCLRQATPLDPGREELRKKEWQIDVPTIGNIYRPCPAIVRYFNGLGICFSRSGWKDERHWSQRAWTMQERNGADKYNDTYIDIYIDAGSPDGQSLLSIKPLGDDGTTMAHHLYDNDFYSLVLLEKQVVLFKVIQMMMQRYSQNPVDKIAGLGMIIGCSKLPVYDEGISVEDAWARLVHSMPEECLRELVFGLPFPHWSMDKEYYTWCPTWTRLSGFIQQPELTPFASYDQVKVELTEDGDLDIYADVVEGCRIKEPWPTHQGHVSLVVEQPASAGGDSVIEVWKGKLWKPLKAGKYTFISGMRHDSWAGLIYLVCRESTMMPGQLEKVTTVGVNAINLKQFSIKKTVRCC